MSTSSMDSDPQLLYRFATSASPLAHGVQATIQKDPNYKRDNDNKGSDGDDNNKIPVIIQIDTFKQSSSTISPLSSTLSSSSTTTAAAASSSQSNNVPISLTTKKTAFIPNHQWTLICIQHSFPYLKRPTASISINGVEIEKGELAYPTLGAEAGDVMMDNYLLCNIPNTIHKRQQNIESSLDRMGIILDSRSNKNNNNNNNNHDNETILNISKIDFAGFGLFKEAIPTLLQAILSEHGPCSSADGVIPSVPPVVQCRDGIVIGAAGGSSLNNEGKNSQSNNSGAGSGAGGVLRSAGAGVMGSPKRVSNIVSSGPFSLSSHRTSNVSEGRGIGIPLTTGVQLTEDVSHKGQLFLQQLLSKLVLGINGSSAFMTGGRVGMNVNTGCNIGITSDVKIVGIVQPKSPKRKGGENEGRDGHSMIDDINGHIARGIGNVTIYHATNEFLALEQKRLQAKNGTDKRLSLLPTCQLPSSPISGFNTMPSFLSTYLSINSVSYILQPFHLALPSPGQIHSLQKAYYHDSFEHLYDLVVYKDGALAASLIKLFVTNLYLGGRMREEIIHCGGLHTLTTLLRRVLLRADRLGIMSCKGRDGRKSLWQIYASKESLLDDDNDDFNVTKDMAPSRIPSEISKACKWIITACGGPAVENGMKWKRPSLSIHVRRTSDIALTSIFGMALDMDLWGGDPIAAAEILGEVANLYCGDSHDHRINPAEITEKYDSGYGRLLRGHISIQYLLDMVRLRFGNEYIIQSNGAKYKVTEKATALKSLAVSLSKIFYTLLKYSLFKQISQGEHDISAVVAALSDCPLGSVVAHAVLTALRDILIYCEIFPNYFVGCSGTSVEQDDKSSIKTLLEGANLSDKLSLSLQQNAKLKRIKSEIAGHLARNLLLGQFHDVIAPMLLSRTVFDGRRSVEVNDQSNNQASEGGSSGSEMEQNTFAQCEWQNHWIITLQIFVVSILIFLCEFHPHVMFDFSQLIFCFLRSGLHQWHVQKETKLLTQPAAYFYNLEKLVHYPGA